MNNSLVLKIKEAMTNVKNGYCIYPKLPENVEEWRLQSCFKFEKEIEEDATKYSTDLYKMEKKEKNLRIASGIFTGGSTILAIGGIALSTTVVGIIVGGPIVGFGTIVGAFSLIPLKMEKNVTKEIIKNEKLIVLIDSKLSSMRRLINKFLKDKKFSEEEYKNIESELNEYKKEKEKILKSSKVSKKESQQNIITKEIVEKLDELLKK